MAAGAVHGQSEHDLPGGHDDVVQLIELRQQRIGWLVIPDAQSIVAGRRQRFASHLVQFVTGQLLTNELIVRLVFVERLDHVVAILPGVGLDAIAFEGIGFGVANQVEPMASPTFAVVRRLQQLIDQRSKALRVGIVDKPGDLFGGRRQTGQVVSGRVGSVRHDRPDRWAAIRTGQSIQDERVNRVF